MHAMHGSRRSCVKLARLTNSAEPNSIAEAYLKWSDARPSIEHVCSTGFGLTHEDYLDGNVVVYAMVIGWSAVTLIRERSDRC